ncbi:MAG: pyruvate dehydrogenase complex dihydrolipoamide acetyltransferase [Bacteroidota bacterium]
MAEIIKMPRLSDTMTEGVIAAWHVKVGDTVSSGDLLAEVETDKATMDVESFFDGTVLHVGIEEGKGIPVGELLVIIGEKGEDVAALVEEAKSAAATEAPAVEEKQEVPPSPEPVKEVKAAPAVVSSPAPIVEEVSVQADGRIKASPLAKAMAKEKGIDISRVNGTGEGGRVVKRDIENYKELAVAPASANGSASFVPATIMGEESFEDKPLSQMRKTIARRLGESKFTAPHFYLTMEINMDKAVAARKSLNEVAPVKISFNDLVIKAAATALRQHPAVNAGWMGDSIRYNKHIHVGMAVAVDEGLIVPVIRFADQKGLASISAEAKDLAGRARDRKLQPSDWEGNTFSISNLGMMGIEEFTAIINPPNSCIMAVSAIIQKPIVKDGEIVPAHMMKVTLSCDHRVVDGMVGSQFLVTFKQLLEDPVRILL